ncbi:hypothetical protein JCM11957_06740 [Caminibacter profundus]
MADLALELADLNTNARELLSKYDGVFAQLDTETQNKILTLQTTADDLKAQIESLGLKFDDNGILVKEDGSELSVGNALRLGGETLEEIKAYKKTFGITKDIRPGEWTPLFKVNISAFAGNIKIHGGYCCLIFGSDISISKSCCPSAIQINQITQIPYGGDNNTLMRFYHQDNFITCYVQPNVNVDEQYLPGKVSVSVELLSYIDGVDILEEINDISVYSSSTDYAVTEINLG